MNDEPIATQQSVGLEEFLLHIDRQPKREYTQEEIDEARGELALMNDRVFLKTFMDNKNNPIITGLANSLRKIHTLPDIPPIEQSKVQNVSLIDVLGRGMIGDLFGWGAAINLTIEAQQKSQEAYAVRGVLTSGNAMRFAFNPGNDYNQAPDVIGISILGFKLPELANEKIFCSRIVRAVYDSKEPFLADKYSDYYIELPKLDDWTKETLPEAYHDLWDICCIFRAKVKEHEEVICMQAIVNPTAIKLSQEVRTAVAPPEVVIEALDRRSDFEKFRDYVLYSVQKGEQKGKLEGEQKGALAGQIKGMEQMIMVAIRNGADIDMIKALQISANITDARLIELTHQVKMELMPA
jgi:hypothetical protein